MSRGWTPISDTLTGNNTLNNDDKRVDALIDGMKEAPTEAALLQAGYDFQRYVMDQMLTCGIASLPFLQAARSDVKGYVHLRGYKIPFETTWLDRP
jgi:ABC-type oligopeptide transport system substrate-binding subunit